MLSIISFFASIFTASSTTITAIVKTYGYIALFGLMLMEGSTLPVPSEVVLPLAGFLAYNGTLIFYLALAAGILGSIGGVAIDYYIGYFLGNEVVNNHLSFIHVKMESLDAFDAWFARNGYAAVFTSRLVPVLRPVMSFPAGFARMSQMRFFAYSIVGTSIWDALLMVFGFYALSARNAVYVLFAVAAFAVVLYVIYHFAVRRMRKH